MGVNPHFVKFVACSLLLIAAAALVGVASWAQPGSAQGQPASERVAQLELRLGEASKQEMKSGQFQDTPQGRFFAGESADKMDRLHEQTQQQIDGIIARPESERLGAIAAIRSFAQDPAAKVVYQQTMKMPYNGGVALVEIYYVGADQYVVLPQGDKIVQYGERPMFGNEAGKKYDMTPRYTPSQLEDMARNFIAEHAPEVDLANLTPRQGSKGAVEPNGKNGANFLGSTQNTSYFFRWEAPKITSASSNIGSEAKEVPFVQVGFTVGGTLLSYTNTIAP